MKLGFSIRMSMSLRGKGETNNNKTPFNQRKKSAFKSCKKRINIVSSNNDTKVQLTRHLLAKQLNGSQNPE